jgi:hypothetical protein
VFATDFEKYAELAEAFQVQIVSIPAPLSADAAAAAAAAAAGEEVEPTFRATMKPRIEAGASTKEEEDAGHPSWIRVAGWSVDSPMMAALMPACNAAESLSTIKFWNAGLCDETFSELLFALGSMSISTLHIDDNVPRNGTEMDGQRFAELIVAVSHPADGEGEGDPDADGDGQDKSGDEAQPRMFLPLTSLRTLSLKGNGLRDAAAKAIGSALQSNTTLSTLNLYHNSIGDGGAAEIFQALRLNRSVRSLNLGLNQITEASVTSVLAEALTELTLTHAETVQRRRVLLSAEGQEALAAQAAHGGDERGATAGKRHSKAAPSAKAGASAVKGGGKKDRVGSAKSGKKHSAKSAKGKHGGDDGGDHDAEPPSNPLLEVPRKVNNKWLIMGNRMLANLNLARCAFSDRILHSRMPLDPCSLEANMRVTNGIPLGKFHSLTS